MDTGFGPDHSWQTHTYAPLRRPPEITIDQQQIARPVVSAYLDISFSLFVK